MGVVYTKEQREQLIEKFKGLVISDLEFCEEENYWIMTFDDGGETTFRFMAEL